MDKKILVFGDWFHHRVIIPKHLTIEPAIGGEPHDREGFRPRYDSYYDLTGGPFVAKTINFAIAGNEEGPAEFCEAPADNLDDTRKGVEIVDLYEYCDKDDRAPGKERVLRRVSRHITDLAEAENQPSRPAALAKEDQPSPPATPAEAENQPSPPATPTVSEDYRVLVFLDYNGKFRREVIGKSISWLQPKVSKHDRMIITIGDNITTNCIDKYLALTNKLNEISGGADRSSNLFNKTFVVIKLKTLRLSGIEISDNMPMENWVRDINVYFNEGDKNALPKDAPDKNAKGHEVLDKLTKLGAHLIIISDNVVLYIDHSDGGHASIQLMPNFRRPKSGAMSNEIGTYVAALARYIYEDQKDFICHEKVEEAMRFALLAHSYSYEIGIASERQAATTDWSPFYALAKTLVETRLKEKNDLRILVDNVGDKYDRYRFSSLKVPLKAEAKSGELKWWKRTDDYEREYEKRGAKEGNVFQRIVWLGANLAGRQDENGVDATVGARFPRSTIVCPYAEFGKLKLIDPTEIEEYSSCSRIIEGYLGNKNWQKPLCIALFGAPGTGKSFAVRQLVSVHRDGADLEPLVFNLAQFESLDQLTECFHSIQSAVLSSKHPPLVMFDEFDSNFTTPFGWLKYFLAPMQDGEFRGKTGNYKIGRAIFAFAGGISKTFREFQVHLPPASNPEDSKSNEIPVREDQTTKEGREITREFVKLPDFVSRLHGYLNINNLGQFDQGKPNHVVLLRRAIILRALLEELQRDIFLTANQGDRKRANIDKNLIDYFLEMPKYPFGVRSMEAIISASKPINDRLVLASLPPESQTKHHMDREAEEGGGLWEGGRRVMAFQEGSR